MTDKPKGSDHPDNFENDCRPLNPDSPVKTPARIEKLITDRKTKST